MKNIKKRKILITGSGSGLGKMAAIKLAQRGHIVYATTKYSNQIEDIKNIAKKENLNITTFKLDILLEEDRNKILDIDFDTLINNAAIGDSGSVTEIRVDRFENVFETNVFSNIKISQIALKKFIEIGSGKIIFLSSLAGKVSIPFLAPYCASKFAIEGFTSSLYKELKLLNKLKHYNIQCAVIEPGAYATGFNKENNEKKYIWMSENSYFSPYVDKIKIYEEKIWNFIESKNYKSIIKQYIRAVEDVKCKHRYTAPKLQAFATKLGIIFEL